MAKIETKDDEIEIDMLLVYVGFRFIALFLAIFVFTNFETEIKDFMIIGVSIILYLTAEIGTLITFKNKLAETPP